jgi:cyclase
MPCLLLKGEGLVKTVNFKNERYVGDAINSARIFNQKEVDELILLDIGATVNKQSIQFSLVEQIISECFMPICYGGGVRCIEDFQKLFFSGVEKVSVSSLIFSNPNVIKKAVSIYGSQSILATFDVKKSLFGNNYNIYTHSGKKKTGYTLEKAIALANELGFGEIIINNIDNEGTWKGFDNSLMARATACTNVPVVALGGGGSLSDIQQVVREGRASAVALGSMSVFQSKGMGVLIKFPKLKELQAVLE